MGGAVVAAAAPVDLALDVDVEPLEVHGRVLELPSSPSVPSSPLPPPQSRVLAFRALTWRDIPQVRALHEEWFPIRYNDSFYDGAAQGLWAETGGPMLARVAVELTDARVEVPNAPILGAVTASTLPLSKVDDPDLIASGDRHHTHVMYILTLGARRSARRGGIASALIQQCLEHARAQRHCGAVYLHVKADNEGARRFYEKNGFRNLRFLPDYYLIDGVRHDAFLYIHYVNDAAPQPGWLDLLAR
jgi:ribosomal protein S18 acetylase RimI-like enzyme